MYDWGWRPYVSVATRRKNAQKVTAKLKKKGEKVSPVVINGHLLAKTFWGKAWCAHLESFSDYANRLPRGRTYVRNGSVIHLHVDHGKVEALVQGSELYKVKVDIQTVDPKKWAAILQHCSGQIDSVIELLQGKLSAGVMKTMIDKHNGLFPTPQEIALDCSCPDWADMCKHVAAVLYGVGNRLDQEPELLFKLRHVNHMDLIHKAGIKVPAKQSAKSKILKDADLSVIFGIDIAEGEEDINQKRSARKP
ncbi:MAG: SWIM zinc finger family protein [Candidatus Omnitrophica bacterium]|nr:SWIM zinc finger family protein [Candidatus Omnitrophota bacterium]